MFGTQILALLRLVGLISLVSGFVAFVFSYYALSANDWKTNPLGTCVDQNGHRQGWLEMAVVYWIIIPGMVAAVVGVLAYFFAGGNNYHFSSYLPPVAIGGSFYLVSLLGSMAGLQMRKIQQASKVAKEHHRLLRSEPGVERNQGTRAVSA